MLPSSNNNRRYILTVVAIIQISMNFNASIYANAVEGMTEEFGISSQAARWEECSIYQQC